MTIWRWIVCLGAATLIASCSLLGGGTPSEDDITEARRNSPLSLDFRGAGPLDNNVVDVVKVRAVSVSEVAFPERKRYRIQGQTVVALRAGGAAIYEYLEQREAAADKRPVSLAEHYQRLGGKIGLRFAKERMETWKAGEQEVYKDDFVIEWCNGAWRHIDTECGARKIEVIAVDRLDAMQRAFDGRQAAEAARQQSESQRLQQLDAERRAEKEQAANARMTQIRADIAELHRCRGSDERTYSIECYRAIRNSISEHVGHCQRSSYMEGEAEREQYLCAEVAENYDVINDFRSLDRNSFVGVKEECLARACPAEIWGGTKGAGEYIRVLKAKVGMTGPTVASVEVDREGRAGAITVVQSSGSPDLDQWVTMHAPRWIYHPATDGSGATRGRADVMVTFEIHGEDPMYGASVRVVSIGNAATRE